MLKNYLTLADAINENGFILSTVAISGNHIMARHNKNKKTYICHLNRTVNGWTIDGCKVYENHKEAISIMIELMKMELKD